MWVDYTDHHLGFASRMFKFYRTAMSFADACTVRSRHMASLLAKFWNGLIHAMEDTIEVQTAPPKPQPGAIVTLLWFGNAINVEYLRRFLEIELDAGQEIRLITLSNEAGLNLITVRPIQSLAKIEILLGIWSVEPMVKAAIQADVCIIPSDVADPRKAAAGSSRLVTALALGLPTAADALYSYAEFKDHYTALRSRTSFPGLLSARWVSGGRASWVEVPKPAQTPCLLYYCQRQFAPACGRLINSAKHGPAFWHCNPARV